MGGRMCLIGRAADRGASFANSGAVPVSFSCTATCEAGGLSGSVLIRDLPSLQYLCQSVKARNSNPSIDPFVSGEGRIRFSLTVLGPVQPARQYLTDDAYVGVS